MVSSRFDWMIPISKPSARSASQSGMNIRLPNRPTIAARPGWKSCAASRRVWALPANKHPSLSFHCFHRDRPEFPEPMESSAAVSLSGQDTMTIRKAMVNDAPRLAELSAALGYPVEPDVIARRLARLFSCPEHLVLVAEAADNLVAGWVHAAEHDILVIGCFCEILGLVVAADHRGKGIGRRLVEEVEHWARE